ncbi:MAG: hypothetical protein K5768_08735 [Firmicutes bacterium]|nr:hypothetical protein [Bacillota bacterium]
MSNATKITLKELMARKAQMLESKKTRKTKELYVSSLDGTITITEPSREIILEASGMEDNKGDVYTVYQCVTEPNLKDRELQKEFECVEPMEIVEKVFSAGEITNIALKCIELAGYGQDSVKELVTETKNS